MNTPSGDTMHIEDVSTTDLMVELENRFDGVVIAYRRVNNDQTIDLGVWLHPEDHPVNIGLTNMAVNAAQSMAKGKIIDGEDH